MLSWWNLLTALPEQIKLTMSTTVSQEPSNNRRQSMCVEEESAMRYACGFVPLRVMKLFEKVNTKTAAQFVECLSHMALSGEESSIYAYTKAWIDSANRRGCVNKTAFPFFELLSLQHNYTSHITSEPIFWIEGSTFYSDSRNWRCSDGEYKCSTHTKKGGGGKTQKRRTEEKTIILCTMMFISFCGVVSWNTPLLGNLGPSVTGWSPNSFSQLDCHTNHQVTRNSFQGGLGENFSLSIMSTDIWQSLGNVLLQQRT